MADVSAASGFAPGASPRRLIAAATIGNALEFYDFLIYGTAAALVFPSLYEGFGQPPLEAMACGCPVACSNAASLHEVCGDAARLFDPSSPEAIAEAVDEVLRGPDEWRRRGLARAKQFTWEATARAHDYVYAELAA